MGRFPKVNIPKVRMLAKRNSPLPPELAVDCTGEHQRLESELAVKAVESERDHSPVRSWRLLWSRAAATIHIRSVMHLAVQDMRHCSTIGCQVVAFGQVRTRPWRWRATKGWALATGRPRELVAEFEWLLGLTRAVAGSGHHRR